MKNNNDRKQKEFITDINKDFSKLISFKINGGLEVAKVWIRYTDREYTLAKREVVNKDGFPEMQDVVISGNKNKDVPHEYILTFVKARSNNEDIICPNCGYHTAIILNSKCDRCGGLISPKKMHWVLVDKKNSTLSKIK